MPDLKDPDMNLLKETHAVQALLQLVNQNSSEVVIIALGPLSNIALASNMDAGFFTKVKKIYLMGPGVSMAKEITGCQQSLTLVLIQKLHILCLMRRITAWFP